MKKEKVLVVSFGDGSCSSSEANRRLRRVLYDSVDGASDPLCASQISLRNGGKIHTPNPFSVHPSSLRDGQSPAQAPCATMRSKQPLQHISSLMQPRCVMWTWRRTHQLPEAAAAPGNRCLCARCRSAVRKMLLLLRSASLAARRAALVPPPAISCRPLAAVTAALSLSLSGQEVEGRKQRDKGRGVWGEERLV